jgi:histidyl-tRNA synthetase
MKNANAARSPFVLFMGGDEARQGMVKIKNMSTGDESIVARHTIINNVLQMISLNRH